MGVHGLWDLLSPAGTTCDLKSLRHQTVAVDASIWMFHFVKAIRDKDGNMVEGAHILGFFRRIVRLLHLGIRPIFVFDGPPPEVKKRTLRQRQLQREQGGLNLQKVTEKLFRNLLREEVLREGGNGLEVEEMEMDVEGSGEGAKNRKTGSDGDVGVGPNRGSKKAKPAKGKAISAPADVTKDLELEASVKIDVPTAADEELSSSEDEEGKANAKSKASRTKVSSSTSWLADDMPFFEEHVEIDDDGGTGLQQEFRVAAAARSKQLQETETRSGLMEDARNFMIEEEEDDEDDDIEIELDPSAAPAASTDTAWERRKKQRGYGLGVSVGQTNLGADVTVSDEVLKKYLLKMPENITQTGDETKGYEIEGPDGTKRLVTLPLGTLVDPEVFDKLDPLKRYETLTNLIDAWMTETRVKAMECRNAREAFSSVQLETFYRHIRTNKLLEETKLDLAKARGRSGAAASSGLLGDEGSGNSGTRTANKGNGKNPAPGLELNEGAGGASSSSAGGENVATFLNKLRPIAAGFASTLRTGKKGKGKGKNDGESSGGGGGKMNYKAGGAGGEKDAGGKRKGAGNFLWRIGREKDKAAAGVEKEGKGGTDGDASVNASGNGYGKKGYKKGKGARAEGDGIEENAALPMADALSAQNSTTGAPGQHQLMPGLGGRRMKRGKHQQAVIYGQEDPSTMTFGEEGFDIKQLLRLNQVQVEDVSPNNGSGGSALKRQRVNRDWDADLFDDEDEHEVAGDAQYYQRDNQEPCTMAIRSRCEVRPQSFGGVPAATSATAAQQKNVPAPAAASGAAFSSTFQSATATSAAGTFMNTSKQLDSLEAAVDEVFGPSVPGVNADHLVSDLRAELHKAKRDEEFISQDMYDDIKKLLYAFAVPYVEAPSEAEAQCAFLVEAKLATCVVSDDSDVVVFSSKSGSTRVYRHLFSSKGDAEKYTSYNIGQQLGLAYDDLIALAMLLGCDYTMGVKGIGIVNALEILEAFGQKKYLAPAEDEESPKVVALDVENRVEVVDLDVDVERAAATSSGTTAPVGKNNKQQADPKPNPNFHWLTELRHLREWAQDVANFDNKAHFDREKVTEDFHVKHRALRPHWVFPHDFPSQEVWDAFMNPVIDHSKEKFEWGTVDAEAITTIVGRYMTDALVLRTLDVEKLSEMQKEQKREDLLRTWFSLEEEQSIALVHSKRLKLAIRKMKGLKGVDDADAVDRLEAAEDGGTATAGGTSSQMTGGTRANSRGNGKAKAKQSRTSNRSKAAPAAGKRKAEDGKAKAAEGQEDEKAGGSASSFDIDFGRPASDPELPEAPAAPTANVVVVVETTSMKKARGHGQRQQEQGDHATGKAKAKARAAAAKPKGLPEPVFHPRKKAKK
eukprot:g3602.t1